MQLEFVCLTFRMKLVCFYFSLSYLQTFTAAAFEIHVLELDSMGAFCGLQCLDINQILHRAALESCYCFVELTE